MNGRMEIKALERQVVAAPTMQLLRSNDIVESIVEKTMKEWPYLKVFEDNWFDTISRTQKVTRHWFCDVKAMHWKEFLQEIGSREHDMNI
ncbi:hypothetical protein P8452_30019 [Trifolium repens]|nr:hypothetical protein P8452_30019 [Trifolium repens]